MPKVCLNNDHLPSQSNIPTSSGIWTIPLLLYWKCALGAKRNLLYVVEVVVSSHFWVPPLPHLPPELFPLPGLTPHCSSIHKPPRRSWAMAFQKVGIVRLLTMHRYNIYNKYFVKNLATLFFNQNSSINNNIVNKIKCIY